MSLPPWRGSLSPGLPCIWSLDPTMEVTMKVRVNLSMALHVVLRGKSVSKPR